MAIRALAPFSPTVMLILLAYMMIDKMNGGLNRVRVSALAVLCESTHKLYKNMRWYQLHPIPVS